MAANIAGLGRKTYLMSAITLDAAGQHLESLLRSSQVTLRSASAASFPTIKKTRVACGGQQVLRLDSERKPAADEKSDLRACYQAMLNTTFADPGSAIGLIVVSSYAKETFTGVASDLLMDFSRRLNIPVFVDAKPAELMQHYRGASLVKINLKEALELCKDSVHPALSSPDEESQAEAAAFHVRTRLMAGAAIITRGPRGATCCYTEQDGSQECFTSSLPPQEVFDVTGAGDTFLAALADAYLDGLALPAAIRRANAAAGLAVRRHGTYVAQRSELDDELRRLLGWEGKRVSLEEAQRLFRRAKQEGKTTVLANGGFRCLTAGHMETLKWAKRQGDLLLVAYNSDRSLRELKGNIPLVPERHRGELLSHLPYVDAVLLFDDADVTSTVEALRPDILVKGADTLPQAVVGSQFAREVRLAPEIPGPHSTELMRPNPALPAS